jgi:hypothetical protein
MIHLKIVNVDSCTNMDKYNNFTNKNQQVS